MTMQGRLYFILVFFFAFLCLAERLHAQKDNFVQGLAVNNFLSRNKKPELCQIRDKSMKVGEVKSVSVTATDPDNDHITLLVSANKRPFFGTFEDHRDGTGTITFKPTASDAGVYKVTVTARDDGLLEDIKTFKLTVSNGKGSPFLNRMWSGFTGFIRTVGGLIEHLPKKLAAKGSFFQEFSGPGPFVKGGLTYNIFELSNVLALNISGSFGVSLQNDLNYDQNAVMSGSNTKVRIFSVDPTVEFVLPKGLRGGIALVFDRFSGDRFDTFTNKSFALSLASPEFLGHLRFVVVGHHYDLNAVQFGAVAEELGPEFIAEFVIQVSF